jgi:hypothetical protein
MANAIRVGEHLLGPVASDSWEGPDNQTTKGRIMNHYPNIADHGLIACSRDTGRNAQRPGTRIAA